jgi:hypothetical protein
MPTPTPIWSLEARWWAGHARLLAATNSSTELTFAKGYQARVAARQASAATQVAAAVPSTDAQAAADVAAHKPAPVVRTAVAPDRRRVAAARVDAPVDRPTRFDPRSQTLAFGEQRPSPQAFFAAPRNPFSGLFGNLY